MNVVLAAIDATAEAARVLEAAAAFAGLLGAHVRAVHVDEGAGPTAAACAVTAGVPFELAEGDPVACLGRAAAEPEVAAVVIGARREQRGPRPAGHVALAVIAAVAKPVLVVPPDGRLRSADRRIKRALVPMEGTASSTDAVAATVSQLGEAGVEVLAVHVFDAATVPRFWDAPGHAEECWATEFVGGYLPDARVDLQLRRGSPPRVILDMAEKHHADLLVLAWAQDLSADRAAVVREALSRASVPVLLLPVLPASGTADLARNH